MHRVRLRTRLRTSSALPGAAFAAALLALTVAGCGSTDPPPSQGQGGAAPLPPPELSLRFEGTNRYVLAPRAQVELGVEVRPPGAHEVRFALLPLPDENHDGVLDRSSTLSDASGIARVLLTAPSTPVQLTLRASAGSATISAPITVTATGSTALVVRPRYAGPRQVTEWIASVHIEQRCEDLVGLLNDGDLIGVSSLSRVQIQEVPVGRRLAVTLRAGRYLSGCSNEAPLVEGPPVAVVVPIDAVPLRLESTQLDVTIGLDPSDSVFQAALDDALERGRGALRGALAEEAGAADDLGALLDAMQAGLTPAQAEAFAEARLAEGWDARLAAALDDPDGTRLSDALARWSRIGRSALLSPHAFEGRLESVGAMPGQALLTIERVAGLAASAIGLAAEPGSSWEADASDKLAFGGSLAWSPSRLTAGLAIAPALADTGATSVEQAFQSLYSCAAVADVLTAAGTRPPVASCDAACLETLCENGLTLIWERVRSFSGDELARLALTAAGSATVGYDAQAVALSGSWVGRLSSSPGTTTGGPLHGWAPRALAR